MAESITMEEALSWISDDRSCLAFAGAGISIPAPTCAPSVTVVRDATLRLLIEVAALPNLNIEAARQRLLPESLYGAIAAVSGTASHLRVWSAYSWIASLGDLGPRPNAGHHLLAWLAYRTGLPIVTTNFDCYLERAIEQQGLRPTVGLPDHKNRCDAPVATTDEVAVWKLHGSADRIDTVRSQAADLARSSFRALGKSLPQRPDKLLIVGYSGRDFDIFPWLVDLASTAECLWVDVDFKADHRARSLDSCQMLRGSFEVLARSYWLALAADPIRAKWRSAVSDAITGSVRSCTSEPASGGRSRAAFPRQALTGGPLVTQIPDPDDVQFATAFRSCQGWTRVRFGGDYAVVIRYRECAARDAP